MYAFNKETLKVIHVRLTLSYNIDPHDTFTGNFGFKTSVQMSQFLVIFCLNKN